MEDAGATWEEMATLMEQLQGMALLPREVGGGQLQQGPGEGARLEQPSASRLKHAVFVT